jgi:hypothetical protein
LTTLVIGDFFPVVKSPTPHNSRFRLPNVVAAQKSDSYRKVFLCLYSISDQHSTFELDAAKVSQATELSRKTVYKVVAFLRRVHLLKSVTLKTGRGRHSTYQLNWRKPSKYPQAMREKKQPSAIAESIEQKKCHPPKMLSSKRQIPPTGDEAIAQTITPQNPVLWKRCLKSFRELLEQSRLSKSQQRLCVGVLGRHLKGKRREYGLKVYEKLKAMVGKLRAPEWVKRVQDLCRWFMGLLKSLFKSKLKPERKRFGDYNEYLWELARQEKERVMAKRAPYEKTWEQRLEEWRRQQEAEQAWHARQVELARKRLRRRPRKEANLKRGSEPPIASQEAIGKRGKGSQHLSTLANVSPDCSQKRSQASKRGVCADLIAIRATQVLYPRLSVTFLFNFHPRARFGILLFCC